LQSPTGLVRRFAEAVVAAIANKRHDRSETDILLISYTRGPLPRRLRSAAKHAAKLRLKQGAPRANFGAVYVVSGDSVHLLRVK
jgi:hypothetical protein